MDYTADVLNNMSKEDLVALLLQEQNKNRIIEEKLAILTQQRFGRKSEKLSVIEGQMSLFNEVEDNAETELPDVDEAETIIVTRRKKNTGKRKEDLSNLPVETKIYELTEDELKLIYGANGYKRLPDEIYHTVEYEPAKQIHIENHVAVYAGKDNSTMTKAPHPKKMFRNSIATPSLVAAVMNGKYTNAMPLYRIEQEFWRSDLNISRSVMSNWVIKSTEIYLFLLYNKLHEELLKRYVVQADETTCQVTKDGRATNTKSYMFVYRTCELEKEKQIVLYDYQKTRGSDHVIEFLNGFNGWLETDAYSGYHRVDRLCNDIKVAHCWAHARRDFSDAQKAFKGDTKQAQKKSIAYKALKLIGAIYAQEDNLKELTPEERLIHRQEVIAPLVEAYFAWVKKQDTSTIASQATVDGINYSLNQEKYLRSFLLDGNIPIDNSASERAIRPFTVGRSNWKLIDTPNGASASAIAYSLVETAKANNLRPYEYLRYVLSVLVEHQDDTQRDFLDDLLPWSENLPEICKQKLKR